ncbi:MAG TPA: spore germination protein [Clostridia bacterium]
MPKKKERRIDLTLIQEKLNDCPDVKQKNVFIEERHEAWFFYIHENIDNDLIQRDFISPIINMTYKQLSDVKAVKNLPNGSIKLVYGTNEAVREIFSGSIVFVFDLIPYAISCKIDKVKKRDLTEPSTEKNIRGPHEGFLEVLEVNIGILRRKIRNNALKFKTVTLGSITNQTVAIAYIEGIANQDLVEGLFKKISSIKMDGFPTIGYIEQSIITHPSSLFPQLLNTERPDKAVAALLEGRIVILMDGTPVALIAPVTFISFFQSLDDYSNPWVLGSFLRIVRILGGIFIAVFMPALYIAITSFHYYAVPLELLLSLAKSRVAVPFPPIIEILILEITVELIREASIRLPTYIGTAVSVFAGLVIGQAAVEAGIVSNLVIVIVAATATASYVVPSTDMALSIRIIRFIFMIAASVFGIIGIVACTVFILGHLIVLDSLGQPYLTPFSPFAPEGLKDSIIRLPIKAQNRRPVETRAGKKVRSE